MIDDFLAWHISGVVRCNRIFPLECIIRSGKENTNDGRTSKHSECRYATKWQTFQWKCQLASGNSTNMTGQKLIDQPTYCHFKLAIFYENFIKMHPNYLFIHEFMNYLSNFSCIYLFIYLFMHLLIYLFLELLISFLFYYLFIYISLCLCIYFF